MKHVIHAGLVLAATLTPVALYARQADGQAQQGERQRGPRAEPARPVGTPPADGGLVGVALAPGIAGATADQLFTRPFIDTDEIRQTPVPHRYIHGGFTGTDLKFSYYFPAGQKYDGRFFQYVTPVPDSENTAQNARGPGGGNVGFAVNNGGYFVETNGGGASASAGPGRKTDPSIGGYRANAAAAQFSRVIAMKLFGGKRPYGYIWGGSGGGYRTMGCVENTIGVWDGAVPFVIGSPMASPYNFTIPLYAHRVLDKKWAQIVDALDVGGSGDPYAGLNSEESAALKEFLGMGFPIPALRGATRGGLGAFPVLYPGFLADDPTFFTDFWTKPGYEGFNPPQSLLDARILFKTRVSKLILADEANKLGLRLRPQMGEARGSAELAWQAMVGPDGTEGPVAIEVENVPATDVGVAADLRIDSGAGKGDLLRFQRLEGHIVLMQRGNEAALAKLKVGDEVQIDNLNWLAAQTYHRYQVPTPDYYPWNQFRDAKGNPKYPQRAKLMGPSFAMGAAGTIPTGRFNGKVIMVDNLSDPAAWPWSADWYRTKAREFYGPNFERDKYRVWFTQYAAHGGGGGAELVPFDELLQQALLDVSAWVEKGIQPSPSTSYKVVGAQIVVPDNAAARKGIQPVVALRANGGLRADVGVGQAVIFSANITVPPGTGKVTKAEWDFEGTGRFPTPGDLIPAANGDARVQARYSFTKPGTYFAVLRATSQRQGDANAVRTRVFNLGRVRVVVK